MTTEVICPYKTMGLGNSKCCHKYLKRVKKNRTICPYNDVRKCPLYKEWANQKLLNSQVSK